ncbi:MAG: acyl carrier protein [Selenomonadaceae bacterium]|nr:acyl carrier protein [Selenomonadaceae bacterium]
MKQEDFLKTLKDMMDTEVELTLETKLSDVEEWDSLSLVTFLSYCNARLNRPVSPEEIKDAQTVNDLYKFLEVY